MTKTLKQISIVSPISSEDYLNLKNKPKGAMSNSSSRRS